MSEGFNLPAVPFDKLVKIVQAFGRNDKAKSKEDVSSATGISAPAISKSTAFLIDCGLISPGHNKAPTERGKQLSREIQFQTDGAPSIWKEGLLVNEAIMEVVERLHISGELASKEFAAHILYLSQKPETNDNKTGARCVSDVFVASVASGLVKELDGSISISNENAEPLEGDPEPETSKTGSKDDVRSDDGGKGQTDDDTKSLKLPKSPQIAINIQLQIPEMDDPEKYDALFSSMKRNLFPDD